MKYVFIAIGYSLIYFLYAVGEGLMERYYLKKYKDELQEPKNEEERQTQEKLRKKIKGKVEGWSTIVVTAIIGLGVYYVI